MGKLESAAAKKVAVFMSPNQPTAVFRSSQGTTLSYLSFPVEVLQNILVQLHPQDRATVSLANRHLRRIIPAAFDLFLATRNLIAFNCFNRLQAPGACPGPDQQNLLRRIQFNRPVFFQHPIAVIKQYGLNNLIANLMWGVSWKKRLHFKPTAGMTDFVCNGLKLSGRQYEKESGHDVAYAVQLAAYFKSMELLQDLRRTFPECIPDEPNVNPLRTFFFISARVGFKDGLQLIPHNHRILTTELVNPTPGKT
ncbi:hypothetical protein HDU96_005712 [Phlyctochytrium bullatum]|nr:hypothetical protein HDU96_005712 [Phlyctochytrium bullatum]